MDLFNLVCFLYVLAAAAVDQINGELPPGAIRLNNSDIPEELSNRLGSQARKHAFNHHLSLQLEVNGKWHHFCSGSLIDQNTVVTTGKCVTIFERNSANYIMRAVAGAYDLSGQDHDQMTNLDYVYKHPRYNENSLDYNFAVLTLRDNFRRTDKTKFISLAETTTQTEYCAVSGWDTHEKDGYSFYKSQSAMVATVIESVKDQDCKRTSTMICAKPKSEKPDYVVRDFGAPMVCDNKLVGITTHVMNSKGSPATYSKIAEVSDWIKSL